MTERLSALSQAEWINESAIEDDISVYQSTMETDHEC